MLSKLFDKKLNFPKKKKSKHLWANHRIIEAIEQAQESVAELIHVHDLRVFDAELKYVKVKSLERGLHVKVGSFQ